MADNHPSLTFWLLVVSLASLVMVSSVILFKNIWVNDDVKTTLKHTEIAADNGKAPDGKPAVNLVVNPAAESSPDASVTNLEDTNKSVANESPIDEQHSTSAPTEDFGFAGLTYKNHIVSGRVAGLDAAEYADYAVVLFIWVDGQPYIKPTWVNAKVYLDSGTGYFEIPAYSNDQNKYQDQQNATAYSLFLMRADFDPINLSSFSDIAGVQEEALLSADELSTGN